MYKIARESRKVLEIKIRRYPETKRAYEAAIEDLTRSSTPDTDGALHSTNIGRPTEQAAIKICDDPKLARMKREIEAVEQVYNSLIPEYQKVVRTRFWIRGCKNMSYICMEKQTGYSVAQIQRVCSAFVQTVGKKLGEI